MVNLKMVEPTDHGHDGGIPPLSIELEGIHQLSTLVPLFRHRSYTDNSERGMRGEETQAGRMLLSLTRCSFGEQCTAFSVGLQL